MVPIQIILLLMLANLPNVIDSPGWPRLSAGWGLGSFLMMQGALLLVVFLHTRRALGEIHEPTASAIGVTARMEQTLSRARWSTVLITGLHLLATELPDAVIDVCNGLPGLNGSPLPEIIFMLPAIGTWLLLWTLGYFVETEARERSFPYRLAQAMPAHEMPTLRQYLSMQCRHNFYVLMPVVIHSGIMLAGQFLGRWVPYAEVVAVPLGVLVVLLMMPWLLVKIWTTVPLSGPLRRKLDAVAANYRLRFRNILLWKTHHGVTNAAILGWVPFARYFLMTDELVETLSDRQLEAVFAHEVGHGVHRHMWWYLAAFFCGLCLAGGVAEAWTNWMPAHVASFAGANTGVVLSMGIIVGLLALGFPLISHRFEHQADWFACRHMAQSVQPSETRVAAKVARLADGSTAPDLTGPVAADEVTVEQYKTGQYPNAPEVSSATPLTHPAGEYVAKPEEMASLAEWLTSPPPANVPGPPQLTPSQAGAEVFISALDTIVETSNRSRDRRGWMHPSINHRERLLRLLARNPDAASGFQRGMDRTRWAIMAFCGAGLIALGLTLWSEYHQPPVTAAATQATMEPAAKPARQP